MTEKRIQMENNKHIDSKTELQSDDLGQVTGGSGERPDLYDPTICATISWYGDFRCDGWAKNKACSHYKAWSTHYYHYYVCDMGRFDLKEDTDPRLGKG